jgi:phosphoribosylamine--glycine ligase
MKILIHSKSGDSAGLAWIMQREGSDVSIFIKEPWAREVMSGLVPHVESIEEGLKEKPDVILFDLNGDGQVAEKLRKDGWKVVGGSTLADKLEMDRAWAGKVASQYGIRTPSTTEFKDIDAAIAFVKKAKRPFAIKIDNNQSESSSYVGKDYEDMLGYMEQAKEEGNIKHGNNFILQDIIRGAEVSTELWFSSGQPIYPANSTWETKKFLAGELGVRTGCEVSLVTHYPGNQSKLVDATIKKLFPLLKYSRWTGPIDVNCIVSEENQEPFFLEFTPRLGYSAIYALVAILGMPVSEFFYKVSHVIFSIPFKNTWGSSLKLHVPPYPAEIEDKKAATETYGKTRGTRINGKYSDDFIPIDVQKGKRTEFEIAGTTCIVGECLGRGKTLFEAWRGSQKVFKSVEVPNNGGRYTDGANDGWERILKLRRWGYSDIPNPSAGERTITPFAPAPA